MGSYVGESAKVTGQRGDRPLVRLVLAAATVPAVVTLVSVISLTRWRDDLPERVATHWGAGDAPDGFSSVTSMMWILVAIGVASMTVSVVLAVLCRERTLCVWLITTLSGVTAFIAGLMLSCTEVQRGLTDASSVRLPGWAIVYGFGAGVVGAAVSYLLIPKWRAQGPAGGATPITPMAIGSTETVVWTRRVLSAGIALMMMVLAVFGCLVSAIVTGQWPLYVVAAVLMVIAAVMYGIRVTVDPQGLRIKSVVGWPRITIPVTDITGVRTVRVSAIKDFGGYGYRIGFRGEAKGARGFVLRSGDAILIERTDGGRQVIVVDDAQTAAGLLEAYRLRA